MPAVDELSAEVLPQSALGGPLGCAYSRVSKSRENGLYSITKEGGSRKTLGGKDEMNFGNARLIKIIGAKNTTVNKYILKRSLLKIVGSVD